jgi:hypothetical protein
MKKSLIKPMHNRALRLLCFLFLGTFFSNIQSITAQAIYDANGQPISFLNARKVHKVGTDGSGVGNITLYTNVITISGQPIDCIIKTVSLNNCTFALPTGAAGGTIPFDYSAPSATFLSGNNDSFFSPMMNFSSSGYVEFQMEFILGNSYNNSTNTGTPVILQNAFANSYDIDGGGGSSYQFSEFGGFIQSTLGTGGNISTAYNSSSGLTKFQSTSTANQTQITGDAHRVKVKYAFLSKFTFTLGQTGSGVAYYFVDLGPGKNWSATPTTYDVIALDLSTDSAGQNYGPYYCTGNKKLTEGGTNISNSANAISQLIISYDSSKILNGNNESFIIMKNGGRDTVKLKFTANGTQNFTFNSNNFTITKSFVVGGISKLTFTKNGGGTFTTAVIEALLDSIYYNNLIGSTGIRTFEVSIQEGAYTSNLAQYIMHVDCAALPVELVHFTALATNHVVELTWATASELNNSHFEVLRSFDGKNWENIGFVAGNGTTQQYKLYQFTDNNSSNENYYQLKQVDFNGQYEFSPIRMVKRSNTKNKIAVYPNPSAGLVNITFTDDDQPFSKISVVDITGKIMVSQEYDPNKHNPTNTQIDLSMLKDGLYWIYISLMDQTQVFKINKN